MRILAGKTEVVPIDALKPHPRNPREGDIGAIHASINNNGFYGRVLAQKTTGFILAGNHRWQAMTQAGAKEIPVEWIDVDDDHALRILLADNRTNDLASYNDNELADLLEQLRVDTGTLAGTGYDGDDLDELLDDLGRAHDEGTEEPPEAQVDRAEELREKWGTELGQLWQIGPHRLLCGDSSITENLDHLIDGAEVGCVLTDPPYGMHLDVRYDNLHTGKVRKTGDRFQAVQGDDKPFDARPYLKRFANVAEQFWWGADYYRDTIGAAGSWLVWDKRHNEAGMNLDAVHGASFELCWSRASHKRDILRYLWSGHHGMQREDTKSRVHPTQKPTAMLAEILDRWAPEGCIVADPFAGSGSHLLAAHKTGRTGYGVELDPAYIAVILERFTDAGLTPELVE